MTVLSDKTIKERLSKDLVIKPHWNSDIQPCSVDLHLGRDLKTIDGEEFHLKNRSCLELEPHEFILGSTREWVEIPDDLVGIVEGKSSLGRKGITAHVTAGFIDSGFKGNITLEIANLSNKPFRLYYKMDICQIVFETLTTPCQRPYGSEGLNSHYQGSKGTVLSRK